MSSAGARGIGIPGHGRHHLHAQVPTGITAVAGGASGQISASTGTWGSIPTANMTVPTAGTFVTETFGLTLLNPPPQYFFVYNSGSVGMNLTGATYSVGVTTNGLHIGTTPSAILTACVGDNWNTSTGACTNQTAIGTFTSGGSIASLAPTTPGSDLSIRTSVGGLNILGWRVNDRYRKNYRQHSVAPPDPCGDYYQRLNPELRADPRSDLTRPPVPRTGYYAAWSPPRTPTYGPSALRSPRRSKRPSRAGMLLTHPFYQRWEAGTLQPGELDTYAQQYRSFEAAPPAGPVRGDRASCGRRVEGGRRNGAAQSG